MQRTFAALSPEYAVLLGTMTVDAVRRRALYERAGRILDLAEQHTSEWDEVEERTGVPRLWGIASFERESSSDYSRSPAQGDPWRQVSTHVPKGLGPYKSWGASCVAAYEIDHLDTVGKTGWTWTRACFEAELFNGFGPRAHGRRSGYLWSWSNLYPLHGGKYEGDDRWNPRATDEQCGMVPMMAELLALDGSLKLADAFPAARATPAPPLPVVPHVFAHDTARALQTALNALGADPPITVDGSYGRETRRAVAAFQKAHGLTTDGIAGPATWDAINGLSKA